MPKKQQKATKRNKTLIASPYDILTDEKDRLYVDMLVHGYNYQHIAKKAGVAQQSVRRWFMKRGKLQAAYDQRMKEHRLEYDASFAKIDQLIKDGAVDAVLKEIEAVKASGTWPGTMMAAKDLLSRAGFDAESRVAATIKTDDAQVAAAKKLQEIVKGAQSNGHKT